MRFGIWLPNCRHLATPEIIRRAAVRAEALGYDSVWVSDHVVVPRANVANFGTTIFDPLITFGSLVQVKSSLKPATGQWTVTQLNHALDSQFPRGEWSSTISAWNSKYSKPILNPL